MSRRDELIAAHTGPGGAFEVGHTTVNGWDDIAVYANAPATLRELFASGRARGDQPHLVTEERTWTFAEVADEVDRISASLAALGVGPGDRVAVLAANCPEWLLTFWATVTSGAVCVGLNGWWETPELDAAIAMTTPSVLVCDPKRLDRVADRLGDWAVPHVFVGDHPPADRLDPADLPDGVRPFRRLVDDAPAGVDAPTTPIDPDAPALVFFTSGTTGAAKGVPNSHRAVVTCLQSVFLSGFVGFQLAGEAAAARAAQRGEESPAPTPPDPLVTLLTSPMFHVSGCHAGIVLGWATGQELVLPEGRQTADHLVELMQRRGVTAWPAVPALVWRVVNDPAVEGADLSRVTRVSFGGAAAPPELVARVRAVFPNAAAGMATGWGLTETSAALTTHAGPAFAADPTNVGVPYPVVELRFVDPATDEEADPRTGGEIWARGAQVMSGYWGDAAATAAVLTDDGWFRTGDVGNLDDEGALHLTDRVKDMILRGGENVSSTEVEHVLLEHPDVADVAVVAMDHPTLGEDVRAVVVPVAGATPSAEDLQAFVRGRLAPFKVPAVVDLRTEPLPRNATGKVLKRQLR